MNAWLIGYFVYSYALMIVASILYVIEQKDMVLGENINELMFYILIAPISFPIAAGISMMYVFKKNGNR